MNPKSEVRNPKSAIQTAVILAAGLGSRLKNHTEFQPKGFLQIEGQSLIERSIGHLIDRGITQIIIGTGFRNEFFDALQQTFKEIITCRNDDYATTGSMYTLYVLKDLIKEPFLLLESDLLYEPAALDSLLSDPHEDIILASGATHSGDEVFIQHSSKGFLQKMSKDRSLLDHIDGELVGISKLSLSALSNMVAFSETQFKQGDLKINYEDALVGISSAVDIRVKVIENLAWCEIDDESHLQRALNVVYPKIKGIGV